MPYKMFFYFGLIAVPVFVLFTTGYFSEAGSLSVFTMLLGLTFCMVPWIFLYWFIRLVKAVEKRTKD